MSPLIAFLLGLSLGTCFGLMLMAILVAGKRADELQRMGREE